MSPAMAADADAPIKALLIMDDFDYLRLLRDKLRNHPGRPVALQAEYTMASGESALAARSFDLIMVDLDLADAKGMKAFERTRRASLDSPIVVLGVLKDIDACRQCIQCGAEDYFLKDGEEAAASASSLYKTFERCWLKRNMPRAQQDLGSMAERSGDGILIVDKSKIIRYANPAARCLLGATEDKLEGVPLGLSADMRQPETLRVKRNGGDVIAIDIQASRIGWQGELAHLLILGARSEDARGEVDQKQETAPFLHTVNPKNSKPAPPILGAPVKPSLPFASSHKSATLMESAAGFPLNDSPAKIVSMEAAENRPEQECGLEVDSPFLMFASNVRALVVEGADERFETLHSLLADQKHLHLVRAASIAKARKELLQADWDIILASHELPDGCSLDLLRELESMGVDAPMVVLASRKDNSAALELLQAGAYDCLPRELIKRGILHRILRGALEKHRLQKEAQAIEKRLADMAFRDELTGLHNRRFLNERMAHELERVRRYGSDLACLMIDLDHFKYVNDAFGHPFGDVVLREFSMALKKLVRATDMLFRIGGEEIIALLPDTSIEGALNVAEKIRGHFEEKIYKCGDDAITVTVSIGVATSKKHNATDIQTLLSYTDKALYRAKAEGRNRVNIYEETKGQLAGAVTTAFFPVQYIREQLSLILDKTKQAAVAAIQRLIMDRNAMEFQAHNQRVLNYLELMGRELNVPPHFMGAIKRAAQMHDYLKVVLSEGLLSHAGPLTEQQRAELEEHPYVLAECADIFDFFADERECLLSHHERYDGLGYPEGLSGDQIPLGARVLAIVDAFVAMTSDRPHRPRLSGEEVVRELANNAGRQFDPTLTAAFLEILERNGLLEAPRELLQCTRDALRESHRGLEPLSKLPRP